MEEPRIIVLDATQWREVLDFYDALLQAIGAPHWHGMNINALIDSMIWGGINAVDPPYVIRIIHADKLPGDVKQKISDSASDLLKARGEYLEQRGEAIAVSIEMV